MNLPCRALAIFDFGQERIHRVHGAADLSYNWSSEISRPTVPLPVCASRTRAVASLTVRFALS